MLQRKSDSALALKVTVLQRPPNYVSNCGRTNEKELTKELEANASNISGSKKDANVSAAEDLNS